MLELNPPVNTNLAIPQKILGEKDIAYVNFRRFKKASSPKVRDSGGKIFGPTPLGESDPKSGLRAFFNNRFGDFKMGTIAPTKLCLGKCPKSILLGLIELLLAEGLLCILLVCRCKSLIDKLVFTFLTFKKLYMFMNQLNLRFGDFHYST